MLGFDFFLRLYSVRNIYRGLLIMDDPIYCLSQNKYYDNVILPYLLKGSSMLSQVMIREGGRKKNPEKVWSFAKPPSDQG